MNTVRQCTQERDRSIVESVTDAGERELLSRVAARDRDAMRDFFLLYHRRLTRFLARVTSRRELVEEIVNDTLLIVWQRAAEFRGGSRVSTWVMGIAWRHGLKSCRRERRLAAYPALPEIPTVLESDAFESRDSLERAMRALSPEHRAVIELAYVGGYSCEEIATIMGCPANTVKTRMFYARRRVRASLDEANARDVVAGTAAPSVDLSKLAADGRRLSAPVVHDDAPFPDADTNPATAPIHTFHLGLWFGSPAAAVSAGCPNTMTPFNGDHKAGIQVLSTRNFPAGNGPSRHLVP